MKYILAILVSLLTLWTARGAAGAAGEPDIVYRWAPVIYQEDERFNPVARENVFTTFNFDQDWRANNNALNLPYYLPAKAVYYSLVESETHYYIGYYLYYPRCTGRNDHEHDLHGIMAVVRKGGGEAEKLDALLVRDPQQWQRWAGSRVRQENGRMILVAGPGTHEISAGRARGPAGLGGIYPLPPAGQAALPHAGYRLVDLGEVWQHRNAVGQGRTFQRWGYLDSFDDPQVSVPWAWEYRRVNWLSKPAEMVRLICGGTKKPIKYLYNPYAGQ